MSQNFKNTALVVLFLGIIAESYLLFKNNKINIDNTDQNTASLNINNSPIYTYNQVLSVFYPAKNRNPITPNDGTYLFPRISGGMPLSFSSSFDLTKQNISYNLISIPQGNETYQINTGGDSITASYDYTQDTWKVEPPILDPIFTAGITKTGYKYTKYSGGDGPGGFTQYLIKVPSKTFWFVMDFTFGSDDNGVMSGPSEQQMDDIVNSIKFI